jgi:hypothetical protein
MSGELYVLCEKIQDTVSKNLVFRAMVDESSTKRSDACRHYPNFTQFRTIYAGTPASDPIRPWSVDCCVLFGCSGSATESTTDVPYDFLEDVAVNVSKESSVPAGVAACVKDVEDRSYY